jgi:hypothetical protein
MLRDMTRHFVFPPSSIGFQFESSKQGLGPCRRHLVWQGNWFLNDNALYFDRCISEERLEGIIDGNSIPWFKQPFHSVHDRIEESASQDGAHQSFFESSHHYRWDLHNGGNFSGTSSCITMNGMARKRPVTGIIGLPANESLRSLSGSVTWWKERRPPLRLLHLQYLQTQKYWWRGENVGFGLVLTLWLTLLIFSFRVLTRLFDFYHVHVLPDK